jgi:hypothetical protein
VIVGISILGMDGTGISTQSFGKVNERNLLNVLMMKSRIGFRNPVVRCESNMVKARLNSISGILNENIIGNEMFGNAGKPGNVIRPMRAMMFISGKRGISGSIDFNFAMISSIDGNDGIFGSPGHLNLSVSVLINDGISFATIAI